MAEYIDREALLEQSNDYQRGCNELFDWMVLIIKNMPTADVVPKSEVAREIFEEIEKLAKIYTFPVVKNGVVEIAKEPFWCIEPNDLAELKKKYIGESDVKRDTV